MGKVRKPSGGVKADNKAGAKSKTPPPPPSPRDDEYDEDGDIATPKLDRYGNDDEPL